MEEIHTLFHDLPPGKPLRFGLRRMLLAVAGCAGVFALVRIVPAEVWLTLALVILPLWVMAFAVFGIRN